MVTNRIETVGVQASEDLPYDRPRTGALTLLKEPSKLTVQLGNRLKTEGIGPLGIVGVLAVVVVVIAGLVLGVSSF